MKAIHITREPLAVLYVGNPLVKIDVALIGAERFKDEERIMFNHGVLTEYSKVSGCNPDGSKNPACVEIAYTPPSYGRVVQ